MAMRKHRKSRLAAAGWLAAALLLALPAAAQPQVVASVKPVHSLVAAVMAGVGTPGLLVHGAASPHTYALRPSDAARLSGARVVFWIGPAYEAFLVKPLASLATGARVVALATAPGVATLAPREGGVWEEDEHDHDHGSPGEAPGARIDGHLWLDPRNAVAMAQAIAAVLSEVDPPHAGAYAANAGKLGERLGALDDALAKTLAPVRGVPFVVFHDAYQYLERRYGLTAVGAVAVSPERRPGARRVAELRDKIGKLGARCVFAEPQFEPALVRTLVAETGARTATLDPLGADLADGPGLYEAMMRRLAASLTACLGP
jgi:zinc transport system substrate-binding protein